MIRKRLFHFTLIFIVSAIFAVSYIEGKGSSENSGNAAAASPLLLVINYPYQVWSSDPTKIHVTLFKPDFTPAQGAVVTVNDRQRGKADANGTLIFDYVPGSNTTHLLKAVLTESGKTYTVTKSFASNSRTESFKADMLYVYADRGVYNPGQDVLVRIIAWSLYGEYTPVASARIQLLLQDKAGKIFSGELVTTNEYGVADSKLAISENMPEGDYELVVLYEKARETAGIRVKRFVPPTINIKHNLARYLTDTQNTLDTNVTLDYFTGGTIASSKLIFSVISAKGDEVWKREYSSANEYGISIAKGELDAIRRKLVPETDIKIRLHATDSYGQSDEADWDMTYTARPYTCVIEIDKDSYPLGEKVQALAKITDIDRQPAKNIELSFELTETGFKKQAKTDDKGVAVLEFAMPAQAVTLVVKSPIVAQALASRYIPFEEYKPMTSKVSEPPKGAGLTTSIFVGFDPNYVPIEKIVHVDLTDVSGALVASGYIPVLREGSGYAAKGNFKSPTWGSMLVNLYVCAVEKKNENQTLAPETVGFITEGQHVTFYPDKELSIVVENFKPQSAPGEKTRFTVSVKGGKGEKCLGVSVTDSAVLSLLDPFVKQPIDHFYNPQAKVISTGGAGVLTWPVVDRNWGSPWRDIAYSNWGWKAPGSIVGEADREKMTDQQATGSESVPPPSVSKDEKSIAGDVTTSALSKAAPEKKEQAKLDHGRADGAEAEQSQPEKTIVIRTRFPETAFWNPSLITKDGKASFEVTMPDEITKQSISILATDKSGYIGLMQKEVSVTQPVFVRSLAPASIVSGDTIGVSAIVRNSTDSNITCSVRFDSKDVTVQGDKTVSVLVPGNGARIVEWRIGATVCGQASFSITADTGKVSDTEVKSIMVSPSGEPVITEIKDSFKGGNGFTKEFALHSDSMYRSVSLNVSLPNVFPAIEAWYAYENAPWYSPWGIAAGAIMNSAMLAYVKTLPGKAEYEARLRSLLSEASALLVAGQLPTGAWGFYPVRSPSENNQAQKNSNLYYTIYCLRALEEIKKAGLPVNDNAMGAAMSFILSARTSDGLWSSRGAYFWDVYNKDTDMALSGEAFEVLMRALSQIFPQGEISAQLGIVKTKMLEKLDAGIEEPLAISSVVQGLVYWQKATGERSISDVINGGIDRLIKIKRTGYWEPHWYHAYGGMVELNARIMSLLATTDSKKYASYLREGITWLLSTRTAWGTWHNEIGTASAISALLEAGVFAEEIPSEIAISVNGKEVEKLAVDPKDPFLSSAKLAHYEITRWCVNGTNSVSVRYTGKLEASVIIGIEEWRGNAVTAKDIGITRKVKEKGALGQSFQVQLAIAPSKPQAEVRIEESIPSNAKADERSLDRLVSSQAIAGYRIEGSTLFISLVDVSKNIELAYKLIPSMRGKSAYGNTRVFDSASGELLGFVSSSQTLTIE